MSYFFNKTTVLLVVIITFLFMMSFNEVVKYAKAVTIRNQQALMTWQQRMQENYKTLEECQEKTASICNYETCDVVPTGKTLEEACGANFVKGWRPSLVPIPTNYQNLSSITLTVDASRNQQTLILNPGALQIAYTSGTGATPVFAPIQTYEETILINKFILYEFDSRAKRAPAPTATSTDTTRYTLTIESDEADSTPVTLSCWSSKCPREILDLKNDLIRLSGVKTIVN